MYLASGSYSKLSLTPLVFSIFSWEGRPGSLGPAPKNCSLQKQIPLQVSHLLEDSKYGSVLDPDFFPGCGSGIIVPDPARMKEQI